MSWSKNITRRAALLGLAALAGCGFQTLSQASGGADINGFRGKVSLPPAVSLETYALRNELARYFGEPSSPQYDLQISYRSSNTSLAIQQSGLVTRKRITGYGNYKLVNQKTGETLTSRSFHREVSYGRNSDLFAEDQAIDRAKEQAARAVAKDIALEVIAALSIETGRQ